VKRAYEPAAASDGRRVLVERLWPRGVTKARLRLDDWAKDAAPSPELRANPAAWRPLLAAARRGRVTFIYAAHDVAHNGAIARKAFLDRRR
jgi:uncharacterized protein YeaO (DUF488 family)